MHDFLKLREGRRIRVFENRIILGPKRDENEEWGSLYNKELHNFYPSPNIVRVIKSRSYMGRSYRQNGRR